MKKFTKVIVGEYELESRSTREIKIALELGWEVTVFCKKFSCKEDIIKNNCNIVEAKGFSAAVYKNKLVRFWKIIGEFFRRVRLLRKIESDIISGYDITALAIAYLANFWKPKKKKAKLVYDSHEFEIYRATRQRRGRFATRLVQCAEKFLMKRCAFSIMVNDSIADEVQKIHKLKKRPIVVRSTPEKWVIDEKQICETREEILKKLNMPKGTFIAMYHGLIFPYRGVESCIDAIAKIENAALVVLGKGDEKYLAELSQLAEKAGLGGRILFLPSVPQKELFKFLGAANAGMILPSTEVRNYYYMLPNKYFENIQSLTPVIVADYPELGKLTKSYGIGICVDPQSNDSIIAAINKMQDGEVYEKFKQNLIAAKNDLCWENEKQVLLNAYKALDE